MVMTVLFHTVQKLDLLLFGISVLCLLFFSPPFGYQFLILRFDVRILASLELRWIRRVLTLCMIQRRGSSAASVFGKEKIRQIFL